MATQNNDWTAVEIVRKGMIHKASHCPMCDAQITIVGSLFRCDCSQWRITSDEFGKRVYEYKLLANKSK